MQNLSNYEDGAQWLKLPQEMIVLLMLRLNLIDYFAFGCVCKSWRIIAIENRQYIMNKQPPLAVIQSKSKDAKGSVQLYNLFDQSRYKMILPRFSGKICCGILYGYLMMYDKNLNIGLWLVNPLTRREYHLPSSLTFVCRFTIACSATDSSQIIILVPSTERSVSLKIQSGDMIYTTRSFIPFYISENLGWSERLHTECGNETITDLAIFEGNLYALTIHARIGLLKVGYRSRGTFTLLEVPSIHILSCSPRLVSFNGKLLIVDFVSVIHFKVYELNFLRMEWLEMASFGDESLFICTITNSIALRNTTRWGGRSNCIYTYFIQTNRFYCYSFDGRLLESFILTGERNGMFGAPNHPPIWYFPSEAYNIPRLNME